MRWLDDFTNCMNMSLSKLRKLVKDRKVWHATVHGVTRRIGGGDTEITLVMNFAALVSKGIGLCS